MSDNHDDIEAPNEEAMAADDAGEEATEASPRVRFKGIVEADERDLAAADDNDYGVTVISHDERRWNAMSRQVWLWARLTSIFVFASIIVGVPLGGWLAHLKVYNTSRGWNPLSAFDLFPILFAFIVPILVLFIGYMLSRLITMMNAAESIASAAQQMTAPDITAARNADSVGAVVQSHMTALNEGLDGALSRLASVEAMIRQHVEAIEIAGDAIEHKATGAVTRVADERSRLMDLTESLNAHADSFAAAIAEKAKSSIEALQSADTYSQRAEADFDDRLNHLEEAASRALSSFEALRDALRDTDETMRTSSQSIDAATDMTVKATDRAKTAANAAAESAALNAANVSASAERAAQSARDAADGAIEVATEEAERMARKAIELAAEKSGAVHDATKKAIGEMSDATRAAIEHAASDAEKATTAARDVSEAARLTGEAAAKASKDVTEASERARESAEQAMNYTETAATRIEERNKALATARAALEEENQRLETLIDEQRKRADRLADAIASQTERLSRLAEAQLREQEAAARLAEAQNEMQARADKQTLLDKQAEEKRLAHEAHQAAQAEQDRRRKAEADAANKLAAEKRKPAKQAPLELKPAPKKKEPQGAARLDELARDIAERRPRRDAKQKEPLIAKDRKTGDAKTRRSKTDISWREILDATDEAEPLELGPATKKPTATQDDAENAIRIIAELQGFTYDLETRLYGDPPPALQERFDRGDRNVFANRLLRLNESDVKRRIRSESARDRGFEKNVHGFLQGFEKLLEDATTSETADEELEEYLSSPLGRVYLLIGATVGYFA